MTHGGPSTTAGPGLRPGDVIGERYRVQREIGRGGMGAVYAAEHLHLPQRVAIKVLLTPQHPEALQRFRREAELAAQLKSPHVGRVTDVGQMPSGEPFMVMELLDGCDLDQLLKQRGPLPVADAVRYVLQACDALAEAHHLGVVHRDLKPANLFLAQDHQGASSVRVLDFGIAKVSSTGAPGITQTGAAMGTPYYMAPEQLMSARQVDARADVWALGATLYQLLSGRLPFEGGTLAEVHLAIMQAEPPPLRQHRPDLPPVLEQAVMTCLRKEPEARHPSMVAFAAALAPHAPPDVQTLASRLAAQAPAFVSAPAGASLADPHAPTLLGTTPGAASPQAVAAEGRGWIWAMVGIGAFVAMAVVGVAIALAVGDDERTDTSSTSEPKPVRIDVPITRCPGCDTAEACHEEHAIPEGEVDERWLFDTAAKAVHAIEPRATPFQLYVPHVVDSGNPRTDVLQIRGAVRFEVDSGEERPTVYDANFSRGCLQVRRAVKKGRLEGPIVLPQCSRKEATKRVRAREPVAGLGGIYLQRPPKTVLVWMFPGKTTWFVRGSDCLVTEDARKLRRR